MSRRKTKTTVKTFSQALEDAMDLIDIEEERCHPWEYHSSTYASISGKEDAKEQIINFIISDFKRRANQLRELVKDATYETRESHNADFLEKLIKEYSGFDEWVSEYKYKE